MAAMERKYILLVGDGMGDYPLHELGGKTPLEVARTPHMDWLLCNGRTGRVRTIPESMEPGSDVANMSLLGYDPMKYHTGRAPLEAASMGIRLAEDEIAFRCNLVTLLRDAGGVMRMGDYSAGHISTQEAQRLVLALQDAVKGTPLKLYPGVSYRHLLVWKGGRGDLSTTPPHDIPGEPVALHCEVYRKEPVLASFVERASEILADHPVNRERVAAGKKPASHVWLWGQGKAPSLPTLEERFGLRGAMISAVDLLKGLGVYAGLKPIEVPGATGYLDTNYEGKVAAAIASLECGQFVYVHIEAPDEASHEGSIPKKIQAIEDFDAKVVGPVLERARMFSRVSILTLMDHFTPICKRTHVKDPVPFLLLEELRGAAKTCPPSTKFCEKAADGSSCDLKDGVELFHRFIGTSS